MNRVHPSPPKAIALLTVGLLALAACGGGSEDNEAATGGEAANADAPAWCGPDEIVLGMTDGFGGNSWRLVTTAAARDEALRPRGIDAALGGDSLVLERTIDVHVRSLRKKLGHHAVLVETVRGVGYRLRDPSGVK